MNARCLMIPTLVSLSACVISTNTAQTTLGGSASAVGTASRSGDGSSAGSENGGPTSGGPSGPTSGSTTSGGGGTSSAGSGSTSAITVTVKPQNPTVSASGVEAFSCTVVGATNTGCTWKITEAGAGSITNDGHYTAPTAPGTYHVVATSVADATASASTVVIVPVIGDCSSLSTAGTWDDITPPVVEADLPGPSDCPYASQAVALDPANPGTVYLGSCDQGLFKSTDCGHAWAHIDTGENANVLDNGREWSLIVDPTNTQVLYTIVGYSPHNGVFRSTNGGVDWTPIFKQNILDVTGALPCSETGGALPCGGPGAFSEKVTMDPTNHLHLLVSFHDSCVGTEPPGGTWSATTPAGAPLDGQGGWGCLAETTDAGETWTQTNAALYFGGADGSGQTMIDAKTWFFNGGKGVYRTTNGGASWLAPDNPFTVYTAVYAAKNGTFYAGGNNVLKSDDGINWTVLSNQPSMWSFNSGSPFVDTGTTLYVGGSVSQPIGGANSYFWSATDGATGVSSPLTLMPFTSSSGEMPAIQGPSWVDYESSHHIIYSSNAGGGFWRMVIP